MAKVIDDSIFIGETECKYGEFKNRLFFDIFIIYRFD